MNMEAQLPRRFAAFVASLRQLWARETLPSVPPPRARGTVGNGPVFLNTLLKGEPLPELAPGAAAGTRSPFFQSLLAHETLPSPVPDDRPQNVRAFVSTLLTREELPNIAPDPGRDRPRSFLRFILTPERLPARPAAAGPTPRNVSTE